MSNVSSVNRTQELTPYTAGGRIDPYAIFQLNFEARGGEKNVKWDSNFHFKGEMRLGESTFDIEDFVSRPLRNLRVVSSNFRVLYRLGDDGRNIWAFQNDNLTKFDDSKSPEREVRRLWDEYAYTDPKNRVFNSTATRKISIDGVQTYEVKIKNSKTDEVVTHWYDAENFLLKRELRESKTERTQTDFSDYRSVGNIKMAFQKDIHFLNSGNKQSISWNSIQKGVFISDSVFKAPEDPNDPNDLASFLGVGQNVNRLA